MSSRGPGGYQPTHVPNRAPAQSSRTGQQSSRAGQSYRGTPSYGGAPSYGGDQGGLGDQGGQAGGTSTRVLPGEPHMIGTRTDSDRGVLDFNVCRCQNPNSHGDAFKWTAPWGYDPSGRMLDWTEATRKTMDMYGKDLLTRQEVEAKYHEIFRSDVARYKLEWLRVVDEGISRGERIIIGPCASYHNSDGHARRNISDGGLQTRVERPGGGGARRPSVRPFTFLEKRQWERRFGELATKAIFGDSTPPMPPGFGDPYGGRYRGYDSDSDDDDDFYGRPGFRGPTLGDHMAAAALADALSNPYSRYNPYNRW